MKNSKILNIVIIFVMFLTVYSLVIAGKRSVMKPFVIEPFSFDTLVIHKDNMDTLFEKAVQLIKDHEGWHDKRHYPYVGYGHRLLKGDNFDHQITEDFATDLVRKDLRQKMSVFREYGRDSLILGVLAYNIGEYNIKGGWGRKKSDMLKKIEAGDRDIYDNYISHCRYKGREVMSIRNRRIKEFELLFNK